FERYGGKALQPEYIYQCGAGISACHIDAFGKLSMCMMSRNPDYDLLGGTFRDGWNYLNQFRYQKWSKETDCSTCDIMSLCNQCPGWSMLEHEDLETPVEFLCQIAHLRSELLGIKSTIER
ncbi:SPASM domain-containing protein, partial [candidate division KSB1 bacterium]|nr:SPASM domain-containing protein [candidate division KSB1 bacterium]